MHLLTFDPKRRMREAVLVAALPGADRRQLETTRKPDDFVAKLKHASFLLVDSDPSAAPEPLLRAVLDAGLPTIMLTRVISDKRPAGLVGRLLMDPKVDFVAAPVNDEELALRVRRLLDRQPPAPTAPRLLAHVRTDLHNAHSGRLDARGVADFFHVPLSWLARALRENPSTVHKTPDAPALQSKLAPLARVALRLFPLAGSVERARMWLNAPNPALGGRTPMSFIKDGQVQVVVDMVEDVREGRPL